MDAVEPEEVPAGSGCSGAVVITAAALGLGLAFYAVSRDVFVIAVWVLGAVLIVRAARKKMADTSGRTPPAPSERGSDKEPQVTMVRDSSHPNRWNVTRPSPWLTYETDNRDET